jgi:pimeloyl-ACP methyl ester carboxylesterase/DNA-binding winged helix-turn-helix (wHTH) protein
MRREPSEFAHFAQIIFANGVRFDPLGRELRGADGQPIALRAQALEVLVQLAERPGETVDRAELIERLWPGRAITDNSLVRCVSAVRHALGDRDRSIIRTDPKRGYRLIGVPKMRTVAGTLNQSADEQERWSNGRSRASALDLAASARAHGSTQQIEFAQTRDSAKLAYAIVGTGMPVVRAAHWMTHLHWDWRTPLLASLFAHFTSKYRYLRYDGRGYGLSELGTGLTDIDKQIDDLEAVVHAAGLRRFRLVGTSGGGAVAMGFAARHPQQVSHLVLIGAFAQGLLHRGEPEVARQTFEAFVQGWGQDNPAARQLMTSTLFPGASAEECRAFNNLQRMSCSAEQAVESHRVSNQTDLTDRLHAIRSPTLVLHCTGDARIPFDQGRLLATRIHGAEFVPLASENHIPLPHEAAYRQMMAAIDRFLEADTA